MELDEELKKEVEILIRNLMLRESIRDYKIHFKGKSEAGENYAAEILFLDVVPKDSKEPYNLVVKTAKRSKDLSKETKVYKTYQREVFVYSKVFKTFERFINESCTDFCFNFVPKVYAISDVIGKETFIFENLKSQCFKLHDRKKPWNMDHSLMAMKTYGEFHALSMALRDKKPEEFENLVGQMPDLSEELCEGLDIQEIFRPTLEKIDEFLRARGRDDLVKKYEGFIDKIGEMFHSREDKSEKIVIGHADCWNNNFMFKYKDEDESKPTSIRLLDFQMSMPICPVKDLSFNIYTTCDKSTLDHFDQLLETYHSSLSECLQKFGCKSNEIFSFEKLKEQWKKYGMFGLITILYVMKLCLVDKEDILDSTETSEESGSKNEHTADVSPKIEGEYYRRILDCYIHFGDNFL